MAENTHLVDHGQIDLTLVEDQCCLLQEALANVCRRWHHLCRCDERILPSRVWSVETSRGPCRLVARLLRLSSLFYRCLCLCWCWCRCLRFLLMGGWFVGVLRIQTLVGECCLMIRSRLYLILEACGKGSVACALVLCIHRAVVGHQAFHFHFRHPRRHCDCACECEVAQLVSLPC